MKQLSLRNTHLGLFPLLLVLYETVVYLSNDMYLPALGKIQHDLQTTIELTQFTLTSWFLGTAALQMFMGPLSDRIGRRPVLLLGGWIFIVATFGCAITQNINIFLWARFFQGCAACSVIVAGYASIHESLPEKDAIIVLALMGSVTVLAPAFGPLVGSGFIVYFGWRAIFFILALLGIGLMVLLKQKMPETSPREIEKVKFDTVLQYYGKILTNRKFMWNAFAFCFPFAAVIAWLVVGPLLVETANEGDWWFGIYQFIIFGCFIFVSRLVRHGVERLGARHCIHLGFTIATLAAFLGVVMVMSNQALWPFVIAFALFTGGAAFIFSPLQRQAIMASPVPMGARMAVFSSLMSWFSVIGSMIAIGFFDGTPRGLAWYALIACGIGILARYFAGEIKEANRG